MAIASTTVKQSYTANGSNDTFAIPFVPVISDSNEVKVYVDGVLQTEGALQDYVLSGAVLPTDFDTDVIFNTPPDADTIVTVISEIAYTQTLDLSNNGSLNLEVLEVTLDRIVRQIQQLLERSNRSISVPIYSSVTPTLPDPVASTETVFGWNEDGDEIVNYNVDDIRGSVGATGPQGPTGPAGADGATDAASLTVDDTDFDVITGTNAQDAFDSVDDALLTVRTTGWREGGVVSGLGGVTVAITAGEGAIFDNTDPDNLTYTQVSWSANPAFAVSAGQNYIYVDSSGTIQVTSTEPEHEEYRDRINLARVSVTGGVVTGIETNKMPTQQLAAQIWDVFRALGIVRKDMVVGASGANLKLAITAGEIYKAGVGADSNNQNPHEASFGAFDTAGADRFRMFTSAGIIATDVTDLPVGSYDVAGVVTAIPGASSRATIFTVYRFPNGNVRILYGNAFYASLTLAFNALSTYTPQAPAGFSQAIIIGYICATKGCTDLTNTADATFVLTNKFGGLGGAIATAASVNWGDIGGTLSNQTDLYAAIQAAGGGAAFLDLYFGDSNAPIEAVLSNGLRVLDFTDPDEQVCYATIIVPDNYIAGTQIKLIGGQFFASPTSGNVLFRAVTRIFKANVDGTSSPTGHTSTNSAQNVDATTNEIVALSDIDLTNASGQINSVAVAAGDRLVVELKRVTSSDTLAGTARLVRGSLQVKTTA